MATALLAIGATGIAGATAHGEAGVATSINGVDGPIAYTVALAEDHTAATIRLASGTFDLTPDRSAITVSAADGDYIDTIPTTMGTETGQQLTVEPELDSTATVLTLKPVNGPVTGADSAPQAVALKSIGDAGTTVAGVLIGCAIGALIGIWFVLVGAAVGCVLGGILGGITGAHQ
ncbi:hypothetical protein V7968_31570 [Nocardia vulneris]|uniref:DUF8020 domain-containing protein n=1 Tax=Nocardia brasiliensis (strain ATCC 700358 / HUJEG-1) TaxID=1133849 RepID=K0F573_NOCB7|nr:hypothetical protein [Nocardia brasiliensis]AFU02686.1 hypothetical protein O3I_023655 [Nocardia brasiliensis ATCC 700358]OCF85636.1 hypothetical protein AW168_35850 [Nocardia brasiliensis]